MLKEQLVSLSTLFRQQKYAYPHPAANSGKAICTSFHMILTFFLKDYG